MLVKLQAALTAARCAGRPVAPVSACVGDTKNGVRHRLCRVLPLPSWLHDTAFAVFFHCLRGYTTPPLPCSSTAFVAIRHCLCRVLPLPSWLYDTACALSTAFVG